MISTAPTAACPRCRTPSERIHSRYRRTVADLPCQDRPVALRLVVRKFRCRQARCPQDIFCEPLPGLVFDALGCLGLDGYPSRAFTVNVFLMPAKLDDFLAPPRETSGPPEEVFASGWTVD